MGRKSQPIAQEIIVIGGTTIRIGRNAYSNTELIRAAAPTDIWVHVADDSGAHGICEVESPDQTNDCIVEECCRYIKSITPRLKLRPATPFHVTVVSNLRLEKNPGAVSFIDAAVVRRMVVKGGAGGVGGSP
jgi:predicted ribosome quality control (RQC) complex YloA/Tae2 family protein